MRFKITMFSNNDVAKIPANYPYPLSAALYRIIAKGDAEYATFLHERGYGKGFKLFTFSQIICPFEIEGDRLTLLDKEVVFFVSFHLPKAMESFVKGLFQSEQIDIADKESRGSFKIKSVESLPNPLKDFKDHEIVDIRVKPLSPMVVGLHNEHRNYDFLAPDDPRFTESIIYNWRNKIETCFDGESSAKAILLAEVIFMKNPPKSRLITIKAGTPEETKIRGWMNFGLKITAEKRFVELLLNTGVGVYNSMGCGCVEVSTSKQDIKK